MIGRWLSNAYVQAALVLLGLALSSATTLYSSVSAAERAWLRQPHVIALGFAGLVVLVTVSWLICRLIDTLRALPPPREPRQPAGFDVIVPAAPGPAEPTAEEPSERM